MSLGPDPFAEWRAGPPPRRRRGRGLGWFLAFLLVLAGAWGYQFPDQRRALLDALRDPGTYSDLRDRAEDLASGVQHGDFGSPVAVPNGRLSMPPPGADEEPGRILPAVEPAVRSDAHAFAAFQDDGATPIAWSPCRPIRIVVNPEGAPSGFVDGVKQVAGEVSAATGLAFAFAGTTEEAPSNDREAYQPEAYGDRWAPVLVAVGDEAALPKLEGDVAGVAFTYRVRTDDTAPWHLISGAVYVDAQVLDQSVGGEPAWLPILRHEFGHLVGLEHIADDSQLMNPVTADVHTFQAGDLTGLATLGRGPCAPDI